MRNWFKLYGWLINDTIKLLFLAMCAICGYIAGHYAYIMIERSIFG